jgi:hypothetical protein
MHTGFWWGNLREREGQLGRPRRRGEDDIKIEIYEVGRGAFTALTWLRKGTGGGLL